MKLYTFMGSTTCRPVMFFAADAGIPLDYEMIDLMSGQQYGPEYSAINPNNLVPVLDDGDFRLTESSAILKYLADKVSSPAYPKDLKQRARVNEAMDWFNTNFYHAFGYGLCYPQVLDHFKLANPEWQKTALEAAKQRSSRLLGLLDAKLKRSGEPYLCGKDITIADYFASGILSAGETIGCKFADYPNVRRWYARMMERPNWKTTNAGVFQWAEAIRGPAYVNL